MRPHEWRRTSDYSIQSGPWRIAKTFVHGVPKYTLTNERVTHEWCGFSIVKIVGIYDTADEAKAAAG